MTDPGKPTAELVETVAADIERDIRIAIWNTCCWQGKAQEVAQSFIRHAMDESCMKRALATIARLEAEVRRKDNVLLLFEHSAYPVSTIIHPRGHNWSEAYLDQALEALAALTPEPRP